MFDVLSRGFRSARMLLEGKAELTEAALEPALREVRASLIQADVELGVIKRFLGRVKERSLGEIVPLQVAGQSIKVQPQDWFVKACYDELVDLMGPVDATLDLEGRPAVVMLVGLQGSGKTTTAGKLAKRLAAEGHRPLLVAADIYRPAAVDQLLILGRKLGVPVFAIKGMNPVELSRLAVTQARNVGRDVVIIDTAGRLAIDDKLMQEVADIKAAVQPKNILFVVDAMIGQDAVNTAKAFDERLNFTGFILTKLDGDARGGAALAIKEVTGKPIKFLGQGEALDKLEPFRPEGLAQRILGFGDVVGLMQDFERHVDKAEAEKGAERLLSGSFGYDDFMKQVRMIRRMGPLKELMARMPGISSMMDQIPPEALDDRELDRTLAIVQSMTLQERRDPDLLNDRRMRRIALGSGRSFLDVRSLHDRFLQMRMLMRGMGDLINNPNAIGELQKRAQELARQGKLPGLGAAPAPTTDEKLARRQKQLEIRRKAKNRRAD